MPPPISDAPGDVDMMSTLRRLSATVADMVHSRLELATLEAGETIERLVRILVVAFAAVLLLAAALVAFSALLIFAVDESHRVTALTVMVLVYLVGGLALFGWLFAMLRGGLSPFGGTLAELRNDARTLRGVAAGVSR